jgi:tRNA A37 threonylcarbamoyladenosine biosynthesis protein TsaE
MYYSLTCVFLAESGAGKTQFVKALLRKVHAGIEHLSIFFVLFKCLD